MRRLHERRNASRYPIDRGTIQGRVSPGLFVPVWRPSFLGRVVDLSVSGCRLFSEEGLPLETRVDVEFSLRDDPEPLSARAIVRHRRTTLADGRYCWDLGLRFERMNSRDALLLERRLATGRVGPAVGRSTRPTG